MCTLQQHCLTVLLRWRIQLTEQSLKITSSYFYQITTAKQHTACTMHVTSTTKLYLDHFNLHFYFIQILHDTDILFYTDSMNDFMMHTWALRSSWTTLEYVSRHISHCCLVLAINLDDVTHCARCRLACFIVLLRRHAVG